MEDYQKLSQLISNNKGELCLQLEGLSLPADIEQIKRICIDFICVLTSKDAEYMKQLSLLEQDLISPVLKVIEFLYSSDINFCKQGGNTLSKEQKQQVMPCEKRFSAKRVAKESSPAMIGAAAGTLIATLCKPSSWGVILLSSVVSATVGKVLFDLYVEHNGIYHQPGNEYCTDSEYKLNSEDVGNIINGLETIGECIDTVLLTYRRHLSIMQDEYMHKVESFNLDKKYISVLECYQTILGNMYSVELTPIVADTIKQVSSSLSRLGYKIVRYYEGMRNLFDIKEGACSEPEEFKPAIIKKEDDKETLILKGEVVIPSKN